MERTGFELTKGSASFQTMVHGKILKPRTTRVHLAISVFVYGSHPSGAPFKEVSQTVVVNVNGCLLEMSTPVRKEQSLLITNMKTNEEMPCIVVSLGTGNLGKSAVGLRFSQPSPRFWGLSFPPEDWNPADRKLPTPGSR
jgi:hypothetical protein